MADSMRPGGGGRFKALVRKLAKRKGVESPQRLAAFIGRRKYKGRMNKMAAAGRKRAAAE